MKDSFACPIPQKRSPSLSDGVKILASFDRVFWLRALGASTVVGLVIGLPTQLIPNPFFVRMIPTTWIDYVIFVISTILIGITWAIPGPIATAATTQKRSLLGGLGTLFAVGCPTCNKLVLLLLGSGGALSYFAPLQPILGLASVALVVTALRSRLSQVPVRRSS